MSATDRMENRAVIKFCRDLGRTPTETFKMMKSTQRKTSVSRALVFKWFKRFEDGEDKIKEKPGRGRKSKVTETTLTSIRDVLDGDRRVTVRILSEKFDLSIGTIHNILTNQLNMSKVHARWVPRLLKDFEKENRVVASKSFLRRYQKGGNDFLNRIITTDETWLWHYDPETKSQSAVWKRKGSPPPEKARVNRSGGKHMFVMFADRKGMLLSHAVPSGTTVNADYYSRVLRRDLVRALKKKRPNIPLDHFLLHQDNAPPHTAATTTLEISLLGFGTISHPPYSPDLAPFDFAFFPTIKKQLKGHKFSSLQQLQLATSNIIAQYDERWYQDVYRQWLHRHQRCIQHNGEYFEKK